MKKTEKIETVTFTLWKSDYNNWKAELMLQWQAYNTLENHDICLAMAYDLGLVCDVSKPLKLS